MICVRDTSATLSGTCPGLCRKVGVMEFGLIKTCSGVAVANLLQSGQETMKKIIQG